MDGPGSPRVAAAVPPPCVGNCWRCGAAPLASEEDPGPALGRLQGQLEGVLRDLERKHAESLSQVRDLVEGIASHIAADNSTAAHQPSASASPQFTDVVQREPTEPAVAKVRACLNMSRTNSLESRMTPRVKHRNEPGQPAHGSHSLSNKRISLYLQPSETDFDSSIEGKCPWLSFRVRRFLEWKPFDYLIGIIILLNAIFLGLQTQYELEGRETWVAGADHVFLAIYCLELLLRIIGYGSSCLFNGWVTFDAILVFLGVISEWILRPVFTASANAQIIKQVMVFRVLRLLRLLRALRAMKIFRSAWRLAHGLLTSGNTIISVFGLLLLVLYIFALAGIEIVTKDSALSSDPDTGDIIQQHFNSVPSFMLTLCQFILADSVASLYRPLVDAKPLLTMYFVPVILVVSIALMNLVTAVIVEGALANASRDKEMLTRAMKEKSRSLAPKFEELFRIIDQDGSGTISIEEVNKLTIDHLPPEARDCIAPDSMIELSKILDVDGSGDVSKDEFVHGMIGLCTADVPKELLLILKLTRVHMGTTIDLQKRLGKFESHLFRTLRDLADKTIKDRCRLPAECWA